MDKVTEYKNLRPERDAYLKTLSKDDLVGRVLNMEYALLEERFGRPHTTTPDMFVFQDDPLESALDFIKYHQVKKRVEVRVDTHFQDVDDLTRPVLIDTLVTLVMEITGSEKTECHSVD